MTNTIKLSVAASVMKALDDLDDVVLEKLYKNFIQPICLGYCAVDLEGKYKPSWMLPLTNSCTMRKALAEFSKSNLLYHYHFGYPFYSDGQDKEFEGKESAGIIHTQFKDEDFNKTESHIIFRIDPEHPHPFTVPTNLSENLVEFTNNH